MPCYESVFVTRPDLSKAEVEKLTEECTATIAAGGGKVEKTEYWGLRSLAYKINKNSKGHYVLLGIDAPADAVKEMERTIRINENVVRNLTIRVDEIDSKPSAILRSNEDEPKAGAA